MSEPAGTNGLVDTETALQREAEVIGARFPEVSRAEVERRLRESFEQLANGATVQSHLVTVAGAALTNELLAEGKHFHSPIE